MLKETVHSTKPTTLILLNNVLYLHCSLTSYLVKARSRGKSPVSDEMYFDHGKYIALVVESIR